MVSRSSRWRRSSVYLDVSNIDALPGQPAQQRCCTYYSSCTSSCYIAELCRQDRWQVGAFFWARACKQTPTPRKYERIRVVGGASCSSSRKALSCAWPPPCPGLPGCRAGTHIPHLCHQESREHTFQYSTCGRRATAHTHKCEGFRISSTSDAAEQGNLALRCLGSAQILF